MTECLFQYDRLYLNAAYHEPDEHRHLLSHMIIGVSQRVRCREGPAEDPRAGLICEHNLHIKRAP